MSDQRRTILAPPVVLAYFDNMHELSIARDILDIVRQNIPPGNITNVRIVRMRIGAMAGVVPDSLEFCFQTLAQGTPVEGAELIMERIPLIVRCEACGSESTINETFFICPLCKSQDLTITSGKELEVSEIEVEEGDNDQ
jgi:hydrogenase nickel incorporation protein HypA/HybF